MEYVLRNVFLTLLDQKEATFADIPRILRDKAYRTQACRNITNPHVMDFWQKEYNKYPKRYIAEMIAPIMNKVGSFLAHPLLSSFLNERPRQLSFRQIMDSGQVLVINLSKGELGEDAANLIGSLLLTSVALAGYSRASISEEQRRPVYVYADEFQSITTTAFVDMASELRKYGVALTLSSQFMERIDREVREAIIGNFGSIICFRLGASDATRFEKEFYPTFLRYDLMSLENYHFYVKLMVKGKPTKPFSAKTIAQ